MRQTVELDDGGVLLIEHVADLAASPAALLPEALRQVVRPFDVPQVAQLESGLDSLAHLAQQGEQGRSVGQPSSRPDTAQQLGRVDEMTLHRPRDQIRHTIGVAVGAEIHDGVGYSRAWRLAPCSHCSDARTFSGEGPAVPRRELPRMRDEHLDHLGRVIHQAPQMTRYLTTEPGARTAERHPGPGPGVPGRVDPRW